MFNWFVDHAANPIVVRQFRRLVRSHTTAWTTILYLIIATTSIAVCLFTIGIRPSNDFFVLIWTAAGHTAALFFVSIAAFCPAVMYASARVKDELLDIGFSWRKLLYGYVVFGILLSGYYAVLALPFILLAFIFGGNLFTQLLGLIQTVLAGIIVNLFFFSFLVKIRTMSGLVLTTIILFLFHSMPFGILGIVNGYITMSRYSNFSFPPGGSPVISVPAFGSYVVLMWLILGMIAFRLCRSHLLHRKRAAWQDNCINLLVYGIFTVLMSSIWAILLICSIV
jgi:hypothetical protein